MMVQFAGGAPVPSCDTCARQMWELRPDFTQIGPLGGYVDMFAEAKQAAFATPGQVINGEPTRDAVRQATRELARDAMLAGKTLAEAAYDSAYQVMRTMVGRSEEESREIAAQLASEYAGRTIAAAPEPVPAAPAAPEAARDYSVLIMAAVTGFILGVVLCFGKLPFMGIPLILVTITSGIVIAVKVAAQKARAYQAWKATLSPEDRHKAEIAEAAALAAGAYALHEGMKHLHERSVARTAAMRETMHAAGHLNDDRRRQQQQDQMAADLHKLASEQQSPASPARPAAPTSTGSTYEQRRPGLHRVQLRDRVQHGAAACQLADLARRQSRPDGQPR